MAHVVSTEHVTLTLSGGATTGSVNLTKGQDLSKCVPVVTAQYGGNDDTDSKAVELDFAAGPDRLTGARRVGTNDVTLEIDVEEFSSDVTIQKGTFAFSSSDSDSVTITAVSLTKAYLRFYYQFDAAPPDTWNDIAIEGRLDATTTADFERDAGGSTDLSGTFWVIEETGLSNWTVQQVAWDLTDAETISVAIVTAFVMAKSFLVSSYQTDVADDDSDEGAVVIELVNADRLRFEREFAANVVTGTGFLVESDAADFNVQRGSTALADGTLSATEAITMVDLDRTILNPIQNPGFGPVGSSDTFSSFDMDTVYPAITFNDAEELLVSRLDDDADCRYAWEVVSWDRVQGTPLPRGLRSWMDLA